MDRLMKRTGDPWAKADELGRRNRRVGIVVALALLGGVIVALLPDPSPAEVVVPVVKFNFSNQSAPVPFGYVKDYGQAFDEARGYGWVQQGTATPVDATLNGRDRNVESDQRTDTFIHMQYCCDTRTGTTTPVSWERALPAGIYDVTVAVGDASATTATHRITVEGVVAIDNFVQAPTSTVMHQTATVRVAVTDGRLTLAATGGKNTKLDYVDIAEVRKEIIGVSPANGSVGVDPSTSPTLVAEVPIDPASLTSATVALTASGAPVAANLSVDPAGTTIAVDPIADLPSSVPAACGRPPTRRSRRSRRRSRPPAHRPNPGGWPSRRARSSSGSARARCSRPWRTTPAPASR